MHSRRLAFQLLVAGLAVSGCAAMITKSEPDKPDPIREGTTKNDLTQNLGPPLQSAEIGLPVRAQALWETDHSISLLRPNEVATNEASFASRGRRDKQARVAQSGFESFMTLGMAELFLIPKALWERTVDEELELTVWFAADGRALAYKWSELRRR